MTGWLWLATCLAGGAGADARFLVDAWVSQAQLRKASARSESGWPQRMLTLPLGTVAVNLSACLLLGLVAAWANNRTGTALSTVLGTGLLGGYSTFSTACLEGARLALAGRWCAQLLHALLLTLGTLLAATAGLALGSAVF
ncbi:camphor resistance protein CrcB [Actinomyces bovis]|uniref:Fluoride-specific ion channel FluC n=1 Tax=Actinomyces bovis TaxID=1658 RepID=A0ABY1VQY1_9ACTO|nr:CrcB family protein [Actinomyces bovis]SPT54425.1 camphor resistance protein CrcB [Actinomyces bovis]VEG55987.1 camphor resistance protein CrcB [Actinomyces israelii]